MIFSWMSFPVKQPQKCPRNLPIRVNLPIDENWLIQHHRFLPDIGGQGSHDLWFGEFKYTTNPMDHRPWTIDYDPRLIMRLPEELLEENASFTRTRNVIMKALGGHFSFTGPVLQGYRNRVSPARSHYNRAPSTWEQLIQWKIKNKQVPRAWVNTFVIWQYEL